MRMKSILTATIAVLALSACGGTEEGAVKGEPVAAVAPPAGKEWVDMVSKTADGGYLVGNPNAKIKLIEYASVTCSHCREFKEEAFEPLLSKYVGTGKVSFELRNFLLNPYDIPISILTRCAGPEAYMGLTQQFYENQSSFLDGLSKGDQKGMQAAMQLPENQRFLALGQAMGVIDFFKARGISDDQAKQCLTNPANATEMVKMTDRATNEFKITGTPGFLLNGVMFQLEAGSSGWLQVERRLKEAGAR
jgi:protein-disulfide isomerase